MSAVVRDSAARGRPPRTPKCGRCRNHGILVPVRGHSAHCGWKLCSCRKCALITERAKIMASHKRLRKSGAEEPTPDDGPERSGTPSKAESTGSPMYASRYMLTVDYFKRDPTSLYLGCPPMCHYPAFPMGFPSPGFRSSLIFPPPPSPLPPVLPFPGLQPCYSLEDGKGDFCPSYYPAVPQYMPPGYLPGLHYMPPALPTNVGFPAEPKRSLSGQTVPDSQRLRIVSESSETPAKDKST